MTIPGFIEVHGYGVGKGLGVPKAQVVAVQLSHISHYQACEVPQGKGKQAKQGTRLVCLAGEVIASETVAEVGALVEAARGESQDKLK